jgi:dual specificity tyrosine-phosphorylation-regulated kinase 2/3/4
MKFQNILIEEENASKIVVIDFGSSCFASETMYSYIQSRFYRAPEILMGMNYSYEIDMWSVGCMLPELRSGRAAFPGDSEADQLVCIAEVLCEPPKRMLDSCKRKDLFNDDGTIRILPNKSGILRSVGSRRIDDLFPVRSKDKPFVSFIENCLRWHPENRITPNEALLHPWLD